MPGAVGPGASMSRFASVLELPAHLREQAKAKLAAAGTVRTVTLENRRCGEPTAPAIKVVLEPPKLTVKLPSKPKLKVPTTIRGNRWARMLALKLEAHGIVGFKREVRFHPTRKWRFDFSNAQAMLAVEIEGITTEGGRHQRKKGFVGDIHKYSEALILGWRVLRVTPGLIANDVAIDYIKRALRTT